MVKSSEFHDFLAISNPISAGLSVIFNVYLIYLILAKSPKEFGSYKYLLVYTSVFEISYAVLEAYLVPMHYSVGTSDVVLISATDKSISRMAVRILNSVYWGGFGATQCIYAVHFVYRYLAVSRNSLIETFDSWKLFLWFLVPIAMGSVWSILGLALCGPNKDLTELVRKSVLTTFGRPIEDFEYLGGTMYDIKKDGSIDLHWKFLIAAGIMSEIVSASFAIIIYCAVKCYSLIHNMMDAASPKSRAIQKQLFYALICQIAIPTMLLDVPLTIFFALNMTNNGIEGNSGYLSFAISLYPVIDPLPNFFVIRHYRRALFGCCRNNKIAQSGSTIANSDIQLELRSQIPT